jgi:hypothetical protein
MSAKNRNDPPVELSPDGKALWRSLVADVESVTDGPAAASSLMVVDELVRAHERLAEVRTELSRAGVTATGSRGQVRPHPLLGIERRLANDIVNSLDRLELRPSRIRTARQLAEIRELTRG